MPPFCRVLPLLVACGASLTSVAAARAQGVAVQQPVVGRTAVGTTVSVPDRGGILLGGVSSAASARSQYGPWGTRWGSNVGIERAHSSVGAHVTIHDFAAMDRYLLNQAEGRPAPARRPAHTAAAELGGLCVPHGPAPATAARISVSTAVAMPASDPLPPRDMLAPDRAARAWKLGQAAEARGASNVARLHYELAARHGSRLAQERLQQLAVSTSIAVDR